MMITKKITPEYLAQDIGWVLLRTCITLLVLEGIFMILFFASRYIGYKRKERVNLWMTCLITTSYIGCLTKLTIILIMVKHGGARRHQEALDRATSLFSFRLGMSLYIICPLTTSSLKLGVLCFFFRIFGPLSRGYRVVIRALFVLVVVLAIFQILIVFFNCRPLSWNFNPKGEPTCAIPGIILWRFGDLPNLLSTILIGIIPITGLPKLKLSRPLKFAVSFICVFCGVALAAAIMRFVSFVEFRDFNDYSYHKVKVYCWTIGESGLYLIAGIMMTLRPLMSWVLEDTKIGKMMSRSSEERPGSLGSEQSNKKWFKRVLPGASVEKESGSFSDASGDGMVFVTKDVQDYGKGYHNC